MEARKDGAWRTINTAEAYVGGAWRALKYVEGYIGGAWRRIATFVLPPTLSINPGVGGGSGSNPVTSDTVTATPSNGLAPFTYAWSVLSSTGLTGITINSASSASTTFTATVSGPDGSIGYLTVQCIATDAIGETASASATIRLERSSHDSGGA